MRFPTTPIHSKPRGGGKYKLGSWELVRQTAMAIANEYWRDGQKEKATKIWEEVKNKDKELQDEKSKKGSPDEPKGETSRKRGREV